MEVVSGWTLAASVWWARVVSAFLWPEVRRRWKPMASFQKGLL